jgi:NifU-like protein involved in Fe-S cluster formation
MTKDQMRELYNDRIMELANNIPLQRRLDAPDITVERRSPLCGSRITVDIQISSNQITDYGHVVRACTLGQAAASIMAGHVIGSDGDTLRRIAEGVRRLLKDGDIKVADEWPELRYLVPAHEYKSRHGSVLLAFEAVEQAVNQAQQK